MMLDWWLVVHAYIAMYVHEAGHFAMARLLRLEVEFVQLRWPALLVL